MENRFLNCCFNFQLVGHHFEWDRINCKGNQQRQQLGQYWRFIVEGCNFLCQSQCGHCSICNEMSHIFVKFQDVYFF